MSEDVVFKSARTEIFIQKPFLNIFRSIFLMKDDVAVHISYHMEFSILPFFCTKLPLVLICEKSKIAPPPLSPP